MSGSRHAHNVFCRPSGAQTVRETHGGRLSKSSRAKACFLLPATCTEACPVPYMAGEVSASVSLQRFPQLGRCSPGSWLWRELGASRMRRALPVSPTHSAGQFPCTADPAAQGQGEQPPTAPPVHQTCNPPFSRPTAFPAAPAPRASPPCSLPKWRENSAFPRGVRTKANPLRRRAGPPTHRTQQLCVQHPMSQ